MRPCWVVCPNQDCPWYTVRRHVAYPDAGMEMYFQPPIMCNCGSMMEVATA